MSKTVGGGRFWLMQGVTNVYDIVVTPATTFSGDAGSFEQMAGLYRTGHRLRASVNGSGEYTPTHNAYSVVVHASGPTPVHEALSMPVYPRCEGSCPDPGSADWTGRAGTLQFDRSVRYVYAWTVFRPEGDYHAMAEMVSAAASGDYPCVVLDGWEVGLIQVHATAITAWRATTDSCRKR